MIIMLFACCELRYVYLCVRLSVFPPPLQVPTKRLMLTLRPYTGANNSNFSFNERHSDFTQSVKSVWFVIQNITRQTYRGRPFLMQLHQ